ncbi:MAG: tetratricopeptide repeat protein [Heliobacteriaceae bacterium]|nr:tetratricopeptide repeat protein [Heliobacteriaceae bacterium]
MTQVFDYVKQAFNLKSQNCYKQAIEMLYKALEIQSDNVEILSQLGELYYLLLNYERAKQYLEKVLAKNPKHVESLKILKEIHAAQQDYKKALKYAQAVFDIKNTSDSLSELIRILSKLGKPDKIKELAVSGDEKVMYEYAKALYDNAKSAAALEILESGEYSENEDMQILLGKIYFNRGDFEKSKEIFRNPALKTDNPEVLNYLGLFALEDLDFIEAIKMFSKASGLDKQNAVYFYNLANAYFYNGWLEEAVQTYLKAVCFAPDNMDYRYSLAYLYYESKQFDKAQSEVEFIFSNRPEHHPAVVLNALLKFENKDFLGAQKDLERNIANGDNSNFTLASLVKVYKELAMFDKARDIMLNIIAENPQNFNYKCDLAEICIREKKYSEALAIADGVIEQNKNFIAAYVLGAKAAFDMKDLEKTRFYAQNAVLLDINYPEGYYYLALARLEEKDYDEAAECMKRAVTSDVNNAKYYAGMSEIYKAAGDIKTALDYIKEAVSIDNSVEYKILYTELASLNRKK